MRAVDVWSDRVRCFLSSNTANCTVTYSDALGPGLLEEADGCGSQEGGEDGGNGGGDDSMSGSDDEVGE